MGGAFDGRVPLRRLGCKLPARAAILFSLRRCETRQVRRLQGRIVPQSQPGAPGSPKRGERTGSAVGGFFKSIRGFEPAGLSIADGGRAKFIVFARRAGHRLDSEMADVQPIESGKPTDSASAPAATRGVGKRAVIWPLIVAAMVVNASSHSRLAAPDVANGDKVEHFAVYGLLATLLCRLGVGWRAAAWALLATSAFGASDEWHHSFVPGRSCDLNDWIADTLGAALAVLLYRGWARYRAWLESPCLPHARRIRNSPHAQK